MYYIAKYAGKYFIIPKLKSETDELLYARAWAIAKQVPITKVAMKKANNIAKITSFNEVLKINYNSEINIFKYRKI